MLSMKVSVLGVLACAVWVGALPAHHSTAAYFDHNKTVAIDGVIVKQIWANPHSALFLEVKNEKGATETWILYGLPPNVLAALGYTRDTFKEGLQVSAIGWPAKDDASANALSRSLGSADLSKVWPMMEVGEVRGADGKTASFGRGPAFNGINFSERTKLGSR